MKKTLFLMVVLVVGFLSCHRQPQLNAVDVVIVDKGAMSFYNATTQKLTPFTSETDSVVNMLFVDENHLYYTVSKNQNLSLKMLDLSVLPVEPQLCSEWHQTLDDAMNYESGGVSALYLDAYGRHIYIYGYDPEEGFFTPVAYNLKTGNVERLSDEELHDLYYTNPIGQHFYNQNYHFYYVTPEGKFCLNSQIDVKPYFEYDLEDIDFTFNPESFSSDGKKVLFSGLLSWGEGMGIYCLANADGTSQYVIEDSDVRHGTPEWLSNGSLVYVGKVPLPKDDPDYDEDYNTTQPCVKLLDPQGNINSITLGSLFAVRPTGARETVEEKQGSLENCDAATFDKGKVTFYNSTTGEFVPYVLEKDSVINGVFDGMDAFYYTVKIGDSLYLKEVYLYDFGMSPILLSAWELSYEDCVSQTYGKAAELFYLDEKYCVGIFHHFEWDYYDFSEIRFYDVMNQKIVNDWIADTDENVDADVDVDEDAYEDEDTYADQDDMDYETEEEKPHFVITDAGFCYWVDGKYICLSDKINFKDYCSDPEYYSAPEFQSISIDPTNRFVAYYAYIEWGDLGHGPLCIASLDGKRQMALKDTDAADVTCGWLKDGSLLYVGQEPRPTDDPDYNPEWNTTKPCIRIVTPDGVDKVFSHTSDFKVK